MAALLATLAPSALGAGPPVLVDGLAGVEVPRVRAIAESVARYRSVVERQPLPPPGVSPERAAIEERGQAVRLALSRARKKESEALWDDCVREVAGVMSDAIEVIASTGELTLLRDLHVQAGICMSLADQVSGARLHFLVAALLDESPPQTGLHRQEAERAQADARDEILARPRGKLRIVTDPPGARVLVDGREVSGTTPLEADVRLGDHFVTIQRFRYEPNTEQRFLQPFGLVRVNLEPARRSTLSDQLAAIASGRLPAPPPDELRLAQAVWSRAEQVLTVSHDEGVAGGDRLVLTEGATGKIVRSAIVAPRADNSSVRHAVCDVLGETCEVSRGIPWYVWPLAGAVVVGGVVTTTVILENNRDTRFCPPVGCR
jgi:PEGA domain